VTKLATWDPAQYLRWSDHRLRPAVDLVQRIPLARPAHIVDLGCGTGLAGAAFRPWVGHITGVDLSSRMIEEARKKQCYDRLEAGEMNLFLLAEAAERRRYDLVVAADVLVYMADFPGAAAKIAEVLAPGGLFAFTVETHSGLGMILGETLRYAHAPAHVEEVLSGAGFAMLSADPDSIRSEKGVPVPSLVVVARHNQPVASARGAP